MDNKKKPRILTGDRPTGRLHLGHYVGSLVNRVKLQDEYERFFIIADLHTLTTRPERDHIAEIPNFIRESCSDYLAVGIDPEVSTIFVQSAISETYELNLIFEMLVTVPRAPAAAVAQGHGARRQPGDRCRLGCWATRCCRRWTSCCRAPTWCRWARTTRRMWRSRARSRGASTSCTARCSPSRMRSSAMCRTLVGIDGRPR